MDQTKRGRASEQEIRRWAALLESLPTVEPRYSSALPVYEDTYDTAISPSSVVSGVHPTVDRCIVVFATLAIEADALIDEATQIHFPALLLYGEKIIDDDSTHTGVDAVTLISSMLPALRDITQFLAKVYQVFRNTLLQIRAFYGLNDAQLPNAKDRTLSRSWRCLGDLLAILMQIMLNRTVLKNDWQLYRKSLEAAQHNPSQFGVSGEELRPLLTTLASIDAQLMHGDALRNCYEQSFGQLDDDKMFIDRMKSTIVDLYTHWEATAVADVPDKRQLTALVCLTVFYQLHFSIKDKKVIRIVWNSHKKIIAFHLLGDIVWLPCIFLLREIPEVQSIVDKKSIAFVQATKDSLYKDQSVSMIAEAFGLCVEVEKWAAEFRLMIGLYASHVERRAADYMKVADLILRGARYCDSMCRFLRTVLHSENGPRRMSRGDSVKIFRTVETVKGAAKLLAAHWSIVRESCQMAAHQFRCNTLLFVEKARSAARDAGALDRLSAWDAVAEALISTGRINCPYHSTDSRSRFLTAGIALELAAYKKTLRSADATQLEHLLHRMETLGRPRRLIARVTDCSFLFWERSLLEIYFDSVVDQGVTRDHFENFMLAVNDCAELAANAKHGRPQNFLREYQRVVYMLLQKGLLYVMCGDLENDLRVLIHKHLSVDEKDKVPFSRTEFYKSLLRSPRFRLYDRVLDVKEFVERYLERTFYNLTAVALHDRHTYTRIASLASTRYGLSLIDGHLPHFALEQGLDVIGVIRSLAQFVAAYNYSLNQQVFVEKTSTSKFLHVLTAEHVANSLRSHGTGVLNTAVNVTYQLLRRKMAVVSQFLAEEHVRAQLQREVRHFAEHADELHRLVSSNSLQRHKAIRQLETVQFREYPCKRAEKFNKAITQLGMDGDESYLDKFRKLITEIGNALGIVRTLTSAAALVSSNMKHCDVDDDDDQPLPDPTAPRAEIFDVVQDLLVEIREQTNRNRNYKLIDVFKTGFADKVKYAHLENFYALVPSLTVNYVEHMLKCRERLRTRAQAGKDITFTDDGFVMGIAYVCTVLQQWRLLSSLNWFTCSSERQTLEAEAFSSTAAGARALRVQRLTAFEKEFKLLAYTLQSARVFFFAETDEQHLVA